MKLSKLLFWKKNKEENHSEKLNQKVNLKSFKHLYAILLCALFVVFIIFDNLPSEKVTVEDRKLTVREVQNYKSNSKDLLILQANQKAKKLGIETLHQKFTKGLVLDYSTIMLEQSTKFALANSNSKKKLTLASGTVLIKLHSKSEKQYYIYKKQIVLVKDK